MVWGGKLKNKKNIYSIYLYVVFSLEEAGRTSAVLDCQYVRKGNGRDEALLDAQVLVSALEPASSVRLSSLAESKSLKKDFLFSRL